MRRILTLFAAAVLCGAGSAALHLNAAEPGEDGEPVQWEQLEPPVRLYVNSPPAKYSASTRVMLYALPNGNTIEQTLGCRMREGLDWHFDIQHVAAQTRLLREINSDERLVLLCAEAGGLSWPTWQSSRPDGNELIGKFAADWRVKYGGADARVTLTGHSGGGSFAFGVIEAADDIPAWIDRIALLDSNYAFDDAKHTDKFVRWLKGDAARRLIVLAYDDREIMFDGKKVVGPTGGTFRATGRMVEALGREFPLTKIEAPPFTEHTGLDGRIHFYVHGNPENKILHTALVGEMNGLVHAETLGTPLEETWGKFGGPRAYTKWIPEEAISHPPPRSTGEGLGEGSSKQNNFEGRARVVPSPNASLPGRGIPARPPDAVGGRAFMTSIESLSREEREAAILKELAAGNLPEFLRTFKPVPITAKAPDGAALAGVLEVMPDYLAIGSDDDFVRIPMNPQTAQQLADLFGCTLPTRKMVDAIDAAAEVRLAPQPLTEDRESVVAFLLSNQKIEAQRAGKPLGALTIGAKKDVVLTPRIFERANRVAIYGWRQLDGTPIQPLTTIHVNWYVDYSHGVRLVKDAMTVDGQPARVTELLADPICSALVSDEGPMSPPRYPAAE